jgi:hypothetical protein
MLSTAQQDSWKSGKDINEGVAVANVKLVSQHHPRDIEVKHTHTKHGGGGGIAHGS